MRDIKFKAFSHIDNKMHSVFRICLECKEVLFSEDHDKWIPFNRIGLMQYTGLKDKNGKEIYEGYIVKVLEKGTWYTAEVSYGLVGFFMKPIYAEPYFGRLHFTESENNSGIDSGVEVIGNIYENKDILENT